MPGLTKQSPNNGSRLRKIPTQAEPGGDQSVANGSYHGFNMKGTTIDDNKLRAVTKCDSLTY